MSDHTQAALQSLRLGCEAEQLHLSGAIQSYGALLQIDAHTACVTHASANLADFVGTPAAQVLGQSINDTRWLSSHSFACLGEQPGNTLALPHVAGGIHGWVDALLVRGHGCIVVELECNNAPLKTLLNTSATQGHLRALMVPPQDPQELAQYHLNLLQGLHIATGFERIMVYKFHDDWTGEVVQELAVPGMGSYMGLRFPASDIPEIARKLYLINPARMIPDVKALPVPIVGVHPTPPDLTWVGLRSVSPVHLQYQTHMGVGASLSLPIRVNGKLWGLVACHHRTPKLLTPDQRNECVGMGLAHSLGLGSYKASRHLQMIDSLDRKVDRVLEPLAAFADPLDGVEVHAPALMQCMDAQGFAMALKGDVVIAGDGPTLQDLALIDDWFQHESRELVVALDHLADLFAGHFQLPGGVSGVLAVKARSQHSGWVRFYWFRPAEPHEVAWAGNPNKPVVEDANATALSPRRSFERWVETRTNYCRAWSRQEKIIAGKFRSNLMRWL